MQESPYKRAIFRLQCKFAHILRITCVCTLENNCLTGVDDITRNESQNRDVGIGNITTTKIKFKTKSKTKVSHEKMN